MRSKRTSDRPATNTPGRDNDAWTDDVAGPAPRAKPSGTVLTRSTRENDGWADLVADHVSEVSAPVPQTIPTGLPRCRRRDPLSPLLHFEPDARLDGV